MTYRVIIDIIMTDVAVSRKHFYTYISVNTVFMFNGTDNFTKLEDFLNVYQIHFLERNI